MAKRRRVSSSSSENNLVPEDSSILSENNLVPEDSLILSSLQRYISDYKTNRNSDDQESDEAKPNKKLHYNSIDRNKYNPFADPDWYLKVLPNQGSGMLSTQIRIRCRQDSVFGSASGLKMAVPTNMHEMGEILDGHNVMFVLLISSEVVFHTLSMIYNRFPCVVVFTGTYKNRPPDILTRWVVKKLHSELKVPVLALMACTPPGLELLSVYRWGLQDDAMDLSIPDIVWLGLRPSELDRHRHAFMESWKLKMSNDHLEHAEELLVRFWSDPEWEKELRCMIARKQMAELEALFNVRCVRSGFLSRDYLPRKLMAAFTNVSSA